MAKKEYLKKLAAYKATLVSKVSNCLAFHFYKTVFILFIFNKFIFIVKMNKFSELNINIFFGKKSVDK